MKPLILITSCYRDKAAEYHNAIRDTWGKDCPVDYRFVLGADNTADFPDELVFPVGDTHGTCTFKTREGHRWAAENGYGHVLQVFTDTYVNIPAMMQSGFEHYPYVGLFRGEFSSDADFVKPDARGWFAYASGGTGYWTSPAATKALGEADIPAVWPMEWAEDLWAGTALGQAGFYGHHDPRYRLEARWYLDYLRAGNISRAEILSLHLGRGTGIYNPRWMYDAHAVFQS